MIISYIIAIALLVLVLKSMKKHFSFILNPVERWGSWVLKAVAVRLWKPVERGGGARIQQPRIRYRR